MANADWMKKIYVSKKDSLASIIGKIIKTKDDEIVLYIPRGTEFGASRTNFILLKREVAAAGKSVVMESVDEDVLELADTAGLKAINPFIRRRQRAVSDIVLVIPSRPADIRPVLTTPLKPEITPDRATREEKPEPAKILDKEKTELTPRRFLKATGIAVLLTVIAVLVLTFLPRAKIELTLEKKNLDFVGTMVTSAAIKENNFNHNQVTIRGVTFLEKRNITQAYPASGKKYAEKKATGEVVIYNNYSSSPQTLVATTRLVSPDGKIYRLNNSITVPGAEAPGGKITPSSIRASIFADKPGEAYNLSPGVKFRIPGFEGSPKYDGFYAELKEPLSGGFVGETSLPSEEDLAAARAETEKRLEEAIKTQLLFNLPPEVKVLNNAYEFKVTETKVNETANEEGKFTITAYGEVKLIGFRESELVDVLGRGLIAKNGNDFRAENYELDYGVPTLNTADGFLNTPLKFKSVWTRTFDDNRFKSEAAGKNRADLQALVFAIPGIQSGEVRLWPFWVTKVPKNADRIIVDVK